MLNFEVLALLALLMGLTGGLAPQQLAQAADGPTTWTGLVGGEYGPMGAWQFMRFYPDMITIDAGDTVVWKLASAEPHTVTFPKVGESTDQLSLTVMENGNPPRVFFNSLTIMPQGDVEYDGGALTGSGQMGGDPQFPTEYRLTFTKEGTFGYLCAFHPMMKGTVVVQPTGASYPKAQAQIDAEIKAQLDADTAAAKQKEPLLMRPASTHTGPNGTTIYDVKIGWGDGSMTWMRFSPADLTIHVGDTVQWIQEDEETPHTVTFLSGGQEPVLVVEQPQTQGPPKLELNPRLLWPAGGVAYEGQDYFHSGFLFGTRDPTPGPRTYSLVFNTPGQYKYLCVLHDDMGMEGTIVVKPVGQ